MNREELRNSIQSFQNAVENGDAEVNAMMVDQNNARKQRYKGLALRISEEDVKPLVLSILEHLERSVNEKDLGVYDLEVSIDETIQTIDRSEIEFGDSILKEFTVQYSDSNAVNEHTDLRKMDFIVIQVFFEGRSIYLFQKYSHPVSKFKKQLRYSFSGSQLKLYDKDIISIGCFADAFLLDDVYYVLNRNAFNTIFAFKDVFKRILNENADAIQNSGLLESAEQFVTDCESDGRYLTRLTKAILSKGFEEVAKTKESVPDVVHEFNLSLKVSEKGEIVYRNKDDIPEILNLLLRHYVIDALTSSKMIAMAIQKYQV